MIETKPKIMGMTPGQVRSFKKLAAESELHELYSKLQATQTILNSMKFTLDLRDIIQAEINKREKT